MPDYYRVRVGTHYLTQDGLVTGTPCRVQVENIEVLNQTKTGAVIKAADLTPYAFVTDWDGKGSEIVVRPTLLESTVYQDIVDDINTLDPVTETLELSVEGEPGDHDLLVIPRYPDWLIPPTSFVDTRIVEAGFAFVVVGRQPGP